MRDYYTEFISGGISWDGPENEPTKLTEGASVSFVSSIPGNTEKYEPMIEGIPDPAAEFIRYDIFGAAPVNEPPKLTEAPFGSFVSSIPGNAEKYEPMIEGAPSKQTPVRCSIVGQAGGKDYVLCECGKHAFDGGDCPYCGVPVIGFVPDSEIVIETVKKFLQNGSVRIDDNDAIDAYTAKLEKVRDDPELAAGFHDICEERKAIMMIGGGMSEEDAEAHVSSIRFLTEALMMT